MKVRSSVNQFVKNAKSLKERAESELSAKTQNTSKDKANYPEAEKKYFSYFCVIVSMSLVGIITNSVFNIMDREQFCGCSDDTSG